MKNYISIIVGFFILLVSVILLTLKIVMPTPSTIIAPIPTTKPWSFQSIDTMKYSRDLSREKLSDPDFEKIINQQVKEIADTGATYVAVATPYDDEFLPILRLWVKAARQNHVNVWFRGNFSGWEQWFGYDGITREQHLALTKQFIVHNQDLFEDGDVFTACPECENGGPGDPRETGDVIGHRKFLISEYTVTKDIFSQIHKNVISNYLSMNLDVARLVMNKATTNAIGGVVTIDHYVASPRQMISDIQQIAKYSGGKIVIGEFGAPIPDIHGAMTQDEQAIWIDTVLTDLMKEPEVIGVSYWVNVGGSTELWDSDRKETKAVSVISKHFKSLKTISN